MAYLKKKMIFSINLLNCSQLRHLQLLCNSKEALFADYSKHNERNMQVKLAIGRKIAYVLKKVLYMFSVSYSPWQMHN